MTLNESHINHTVTLICGARGLITHIKECCDSNFILKFDNSGTWLDYDKNGKYLSSNCDRMNIFSITISS